MAETALEAEKRRARTNGAMWIAAQLAGSVTANDPGTLASHGLNALKIAGEAVRIAEAVMERLEHEPQ